MKTTIGFSFVLLASTFLVSASSHAAECQKVVVTGDPDYPPLQWYDGKQIRGASIDIAARVLQDIGAPYEISYVGPFARVLAGAQEGRVDMIATLKITPERQAFLVYPSTPALMNPTAVFVPAARTFAYSKWDDLIGKPGGISRGNKFGSGFDEFVQAKLTVEEATTLESNFNKLDFGRMDYFVTGLYAGLAYLAETKQEAKFTALKPNVTETANYAAFAKSSPCIKYLDAFDKRLAELQKSGELEAMVTKSLDNWRANPTRVQ